LRPQSREETNVPIRKLPVLAALLLAACGSPSTVVVPAPVSLPDEHDPGRSGERRAYLELLHRAAPDDDWRAIDAATLATAMDRRMAARSRALTEGVTGEALWTVPLGGGLTGQWRERGSRNQAGRVIGTDYEPATGRLLSYAHGGQIWRAQRSLLDWTSVNDAAQFVPNRSGGFMRRLGGAPERLLVASDRPVGLYRSDDLGQVWTAATGIPAGGWYAGGLAARGGGSNEVFLLRNFNDPGAGTFRPKLFASVDRGASFVDRGFVGSRDQVALFAPRYDSSEVYVLAGTTLSRIVPGSHALQAVSTVPVPVAIGTRQVLLTGGVTTGGQTFLYALYSTGGGGISGNALVLRSLDGGLSWAARTTAPTGAFAFNSAASSTRDPDRIYIGGVNAYRSGDGAASWQLVNGWADYYGQPASRLHADVPAIDVFRDPAGFERIFVSTDGGLFESTDHLVTVGNLSLANMNVSQYYGSFTRRAPPHDIHVGAQDQGFQKRLAAPDAGVLDFVQTISGDYAHLVSGNGGDTLWSVYPGFALLDLAPGSLGQGGLRFGDFAAMGFTGWLFLAPMAADPLNPSVVHIGGGRLSGGGHHVLRLEWTGSSFSASQSSQDFGSVITALAFDPQQPNRRYAMTSARQFFRSENGGGSWVNTASNLPANHYFWGQRILPHPTLPNRLFVAGSGYSNPGVFISNDAGASFQPFAAGLPSTLVYDIAISPDGQHLFAATEVGALRYDAGLAQWQDLTAAGGPAQTFWHVDYVEALHTARFSTYGRGLWDFVIAGDVIFGNGFQP
jgi:hypothetical protein